MESLAEQIISGARLGRRDDLDVLVEMELEELCRAADQVRRALCGDRGELCTIVNGRSGPYCRWWFITNQGGILVNKNGKRFVTEKEGICHVTPHLAHNPDGCHYVLADQATWDRTLKTIKLSVLVGLPSWTEERVLKEFELGKNLWKADTLEELCQKSGMNLEGLKGQIELWNKAVETKNDTQFGRTDQQHKIGAGPYRMIRMFPWNNLSCGGNACGFAHTSGYMAGKYITDYKEA